ncbi:protein of unknown function [Desulfovibrio sp. 86]|nr:protein of unknown function [Desulfovibrio sp. 86]
MPAGHNAHLSEDKPCFAFFRALVAHTLAASPAVQASPPARILQSKLCRYSGKESAP